MKTTIWTLPAAIALTLLISPIVSANTEVGLSSTNAPIKPPIGKKSLAVNSKRSSAKSEKRYSPATLSAFQPQQHPVNGQTKTATAVFLNTTQSDLRNLSSSTSGVDALTAPEITMQPKSDALLADDEGSHSAFEQASNLGASAGQLTEAGNGIDVPGSEAVSVVDRIADKPKGTGIVSGPVRVRVNDSALRASVRIPLPQR